MRMEDILDLVFEVIINIFTIFTHVTYCMSQYYESPMSVWAQPLISIELAGREHYAIADYPTF
jgi:hypothetical protein